MSKVYIVLALMLCVALSEAASLRNLSKSRKDEDSTEVAGRSGTFIAVHGGYASAHNKVNTDAFNALKEELQVLIKKVLKWHGWFTYKDSPDACKHYKKATVVKDVYAVSEAVAKASVSSYSNAQTKGNAVACASGDGEARAEQTVETLKYCFKHLELKEDKVDKIFHLLKPDIVAAYSTASSKVCAKGYSAVSAYGTAFTKAFHAQLQIFFLKYFYGERCTEYTVSEIDNSHGHYSSGAHGYGQHAIGGGHSSGHAFQGTEGGKAKDEVKEIDFSEYYGDHGHGWP